MSRDEAPAASKKITVAAWQCGPRRLALRQRFNANEIDATKIIQKYDTDNDGVLEVGELKILVQDYSQGHLVSQEDVDYMLKVADVDGDGAVSSREVLHGLRAWFALLNLPKSVDAALRERGLGGGPLPAPEELRAALVAANEMQPVSAEEVEQVRHTALALGATEQHCSQKHLRGAVAEWYLQVEREASSAAQLGRQSLEEAFRRFKRVTNGEFELTPRAMCAGGCVLVMAGIVLPALEILVSATYPPNHAYQCEHPHLHSTLRVTGILTLLMVASIVGAGVGTALEARIVKLACGVVALVLLVVLLTMEVYGVMHVNSSTSLRCGFVLWNFCFFVYVTFPVLALAALLFGVPCICLQEFMRHRAMDRRLMEAAQALPRGRPAGPWPRRPPEAELWRCGPQRLELRRRLNGREIDAARLVRRYDRDGSGVLEADELQQLLVDFNGHRPVSAEDLDFIMQVSDLDRDDTIATDEVLYGLRVWFALRQMPKAVGLAFTRRGLSEGPLLSAEALGELLAELNEAQAVADEDVEYVRQVCLALGASEGHATAAQLRRAVAAWYLNIERPETSQAELAKKSLEDVQQRLSNVKDHARKIYHGEIDYTSTSTLTLIGVLVFITLVHPVLEMIVSSAFPNSETCEYPELSSKLWWTGLMTLVVTAMATVSVLSATMDKLSQMTKRVIYSIFGVLLTALLMMDIFGMVYSMSITISRCGFVLWSFCHFTYILMPILTVSVACCGLPCLFCVEYFDNTAFDGGLDGP